MKYDSQRVDTLLQNMQSELEAYMQKANITHPMMVGIHSAGVFVARRLHQAMAIDEPLGELNSGFYRDDFSSNGLHAQLKPSNMPLSVEDRHIILVDDVLYTGRTIRAAMNELFDYGRPASIALAVLVDRGHRELPIEAQVVGVKHELGPDEYLQVLGSEKLEMSIIQREHD
ncbi:MAG: bifunctional pyr operon transcriptional regulator/uracil phosphoribosyltransferase [Proteobacteria bacterium]|nr:MAG: bifunctional pyr operon transcriptional regulator/uracil phosphoribosyltransferase [Pseudomonadota bacterium]